MQTKHALNAPLSPSTRCYVALGANLGEPKKTLHAALDLLKRSPHISELKCSRFRKTKPAKGASQPDFLNAVCRFECTLSINKLFSLLETIEKQLGKVEKPKDAPRLIDLDLIFYGDQIYKSSKLTVPHPRWKERTFVLQPLAELLC